MFQQTTIMGQLNYGALTLPQKHYCKRGYGTSVTTTDPAIKNSSLLIQEIFH